MEISFKEIVLKRIVLDDIELLRQWRNSEFIRTKMFFQKEITKKMQLEWFLNLDEKTNYYFKILYKEIPIGLINLKNIDWQKKEGEAGLFIAVEKYRNTHLAIYASLAFLKYFFEEKQIERIIASVKDENINTIKYNLSLGFELYKKEQYHLLKEKYFSFTNVIVRLR